MSMFVKIPEKNKGDFQNLALSHFRLIPNGVFPFFKEDNCEKGGKDAQTNEKEHRIRLTVFRKTIFKSSLNLKSRFLRILKGANRSRIWRARQVRRIRFSRPFGKRKIAREYWRP